MKYYIGIDIGGTNIKYGILTEQGQIITQGLAKTMRDDGEDIIAKITIIVNDYRTKYEIIAVGVSAPGTIRDDGFMITGGAIHDFYNINLKERLEQELGLRVALENDANCAALAELWLGAGRGKQHFLQFVIGTAVGGALVINGSLFKGASFNAGEFGYLLTDEIKNNDTRLATLSLNGSIGHGVVEKYALKTGTELDGEAIYATADNGDETALEVLDEFYTSLARGIFNLSTAFDPEVVLIGGAVSQNNAFILRLQNEINELKAGHKDMKMIELAPIQACGFLNDAGMIGAVYNAISN